MTRRRRRRRRRNIPGPLAPIVSHAPALAGVARQGDLLLLLPADLVTEVRAAGQKIGDADSGKVSGGLGLMVIEDSFTVGWFQRDFTRRDS